MTETIRTVSCFEKELSGAVLEIMRKSGSPEEAFEALDQLVRSQASWSERLTVERAARLLLVGYHFQERDHERKEHA